jgi:hypothetical protein
MHIVTMMSREMIDEEPISVEGMFIEDGLSVIR